MNIVIWDFREQAPNVVWTGYGKKTPVILFKGEAVIKKRNDYKAVGGRQRFIVGNTGKMMFLINK